MVFLNHLAANLDNWDPSILQGIAEHRTVITFDNQGVGLSSGKVQTTVEGMASSAATFISAISSTSVDVIALSMGGMVAQDLALGYPGLINKLILVGTGPRGGRGIKYVTRTTLFCMIKAALSRSDAKEYIFFKRNGLGQASAKDFLGRISARTLHLDKPVSVRAFASQLRAIHKYGSSAPSNLSDLGIKTLIVNGDLDIMVPTELSTDLSNRIEGSRLEIYADAGHGSLFQYPERFVSDSLDFLEP